MSAATGFACGSHFVQSAFRVVGTRGGGVDEMAPLELRAVGLDGDVRLGRLGVRMRVVARLAARAAGEVLVLVGELERGVTHLVDGDLDRRRCQRVRRQLAAGAAEFGRVDDHEDRVPAGHLGVGGRDAERLVGDEEAPDAGVAEGGVEVGLRRHGGAARGARSVGARSRVVGAGVSRVHVDAVDVDPVPDGVERRRGLQRVHQCRDGRGVGGLVGGAEAIAEDDEVPLVAVRAVIDDLGRTDNAAVSRSHYRSANLVSSTGPPGGARLPTALGAPAVGTRQQDDRLGALVVRDDDREHARRKGLRVSPGAPLDCRIEHLDVGRDRVLDDLAICRVVGGVAQLGDDGVAGELRLAGPSGGEGRDVLDAWRDRLGHRRAVDHADARLVIGQRQADRAWLILRAGLLRRVRGHVTVLRLASSDRRVGRECSQHDARCPAGGTRRFTTL